MTEHSVAEFWIPALIIAMGAIVVILETFGGIRAAYGRYNKSNFGLPSWIAWCLQESTSFFVSLIIWIYRGPQLFDSNGRLNTNLLLLAYFMFHYFHRFDLIEYNIILILINLRLILFKDHSFIRYVYKAIRSLTIWRICLGSFFARLMGSKSLIIIYFIQILLSISGIFG
jgi:hypothetical protein